MDASWNLHAGSDPAGHGYELRGFALRESTRGYLKRYTLRQGLASAAYSYHESDALVLDCASALTALQRLPNVLLGEVWDNGEDRVVRWPGR